MKKLLSFFILLTTFTAGCIHSTFADFFEVENKMEMHHEMMEDNCHKMHMEDCEDDNMECCKSPFNTAIIQNSEYDIDLSNDTNDSIDSWIIETLARTINIYHQLNAPPNNQYVHIKNEYVHLIWTIKSNC